jgi:hypothetical protein
MSGPIFAPKPPDIFTGHIAEYFERARGACPRIEAIAGKWNFEDLIPGLSDFDARFLFSDDTAPEEWPEISNAVGRVHGDICREHPERARILEHLPGINLMWREALDPVSYYPEFRQWTFYRSPEENTRRLGSYLNERPWSESDELFNVKKFALYYTPYNRSIDPPINLHEYESKYPLHSRFMHYFCPPVQSLVSLKLRRMIRGKGEAFRIARDLFPRPEVIDMAFDALDRHYDIPEYYEEPKISAIEDALFTYLRDAYRAVVPDIRVIEAAPEDASNDLRAKIQQSGEHFLEQFFEGAKFCRLMMGRIRFYAEDLPGFDSDWLIRHELGRDRKMFYEATFSAFARIAWNAALSPDDALERCGGEFLSDVEIRAVRAYADVFSKPYDPAHIKRFAVEVADTMGPFQVVMEKLGAMGRRLAMEKGMG